jgi:hypothetical protein
VRRGSVGITGLIALAACGSPTTPEGFPELAGAYAGTLNAEFTSLPGGVRTSGVPCNVTITVPSQSGGTFAGTYDRSLPCVRGVHPMTGAVQRDGTVTMDVAGGPDAFQGFDQCRYVSGDERWRGEVNGDELSLRIDVVLACAQTGTQRTVATMSTRRVAPR